MSGEDVDVIDVQAQAERKMLIFVLLTACEQIDPNARAQAERAREWTEPCRDRSVLLATTAGSPSTFECSNRMHKMHVQIQTTPSNEEAAALVFCECQRAQPDNQNEKGQAIR